MGSKYYETGQGARKGQHGIEFEKDLSAFFLKNLLEANLEDFILGREKTGLGKFDDLCLVCTKDQKKIILAQLKHKDNIDQRIGYQPLARHKGGDFYLPKYFESYLQAKHTTQTEEAFRGAILKNLLICTNIEIDQDLKGIEKEQVHDDILFKEWGVLFKLRVPSTEMKKEIFPQSYKSTQQRFCEELVFYVMRNKTVDIPNLVKEGTVSAVKDYHKAFADYVIDTKTYKFKKEFLNPEEDEVKQVRDCFYNALHEFYLKYVALSEEDLKIELNIKDASEVGPLKTRLDQYGSSESKNSFLEKQTSKKPIFGKDFHKIRTQQKLPPQEYIEEDQINKEIDQFFDLLTLATSLGDVKDMTKQNVPPDVYIKLVERIEHWYDEVFEENQMQQRKWLCKEDICNKAMEMIVTFQGRKVKMNALLGNNKALLTPQILIRAFGIRDIKEEQNSNSEVNNSLKPIWNQDLNISVGQLLEQTDTKNYYIGRKICRRNPKNQTEMFTEKDLIQVKSSEEKMWIILGKPGIGKTSLLQKIANNFNENQSPDKRPLWIISVALKTCKNILKKLNFQTMDCVVRFFSHFEECKDDFSQNLLKDFITSEDETKILLDGFDELMEGEQQKILNLVKVLNEKTNGNQVWITSRTHLGQQLEISCGKSAFTLGELEEEDQKFLLVKYWKYASKQKDEIMLKSYAQLVVETINIFIDNRTRAFLGIPLQAFMLGFIFREEVEKKNPQTPDNLTLFSLYNRFVEEKYKVYFQKVKLDEQDDWIKDDLKQKWNKCNQHLALLYGKVLRYDFSAESFFRGKIHPNEVAALLKIGLIYKEKDDFFFVHQTFAEYFVAKLFVEVCNGEHICLNQEECLQIVNKMLFPKLVYTKVTYLCVPSYNKILLTLFDLSLSEDIPVIAAILKGEKQSIEKFTKEEINVKDCLGRTPLYYALCHERNEILKLLLQKKIYVDLNDRHFILCWYLRVNKCLESFKNFASLWNPEDFWRLAAQVEIAQYVLENQQMILDGNSKQVERDRDMSFFKNDIFDSPSLCHAAQKQMKDATTIFHWLDRRGITPLNLARLIEGMAYQTLNPFIPPK